MNRQLLNIVWQIEDERDRRLAADPAPQIDQRQHSRALRVFLLVLIAAAAALVVDVARGAELPQPAPEVLTAAATHAAAAWGSDVQVQIRYADLGTCSYRHRSTFAITEVLFSRSVISWGDGTQEDGGTTYTYVVKLNSACNWSKPDPRFTLDAVMLHEVGHVLIGAAYHSTDRRSTMYPEIEPGQSILDSDRAALAEAARKRGQ